ncbi:hypothetical protein Acr_15g0005610 [Actinidia rufa]|uniref:Galactose oxidase/kelch repeat superfamily protein n=1 Tax=Actinidia rufa TaxID=165716 RepID=A0A7J0FTC2_9ERIC|nr:hypothetical protein Acr_15g0005610 [Actinidia rufa]
MNAGRTSPMVAVLDGKLCVMGNHCWGEVFDPETKNGVILSANTLYSYSKYDYSLQAYDWETGISFSGTTRAPRAYCTLHQIPSGLFGNGSICPWVLSSQDYYCLGRNTTLYNAVLMNRRYALNSSGKLQYREGTSSRVDVELEEPTELSGKPWTDL